MIIKCKQGKILGPGAAFIGYLFLTLGLFFFIVYLNILGIFIALFGAFLGFTAIGTEIDIEKKLYRRYEILFGLLKHGKWHETNEIKHLCVIQPNISYSNHKNHKTTKSEKEVHLIFQGHHPHERIFIRKYYVREEANQEGIKLSEQLGVPFK
ncbi:hypothetical protein DMA11_20530 [Marinilabiliaceae bacterium JC017]|nr:hypothetical protein DMA11_20530 [Marinilabiliaceae bacterium JC017]